MRERDGGKTGTRNRLSIIIETTTERQQLCDRVCWWESLSRLAVVTAKNNTKDVCVWKVKESEDTHKHELMHNHTHTHNHNEKGPNHGKNIPQTPKNRQTHMRNTEHAQIPRSQTNLAVPGNCGFAHQNRRLPARCQGFSHNCLRQRRREARCEDYRSQTSFTSTARKWRHERIAVK